MTRETEHIHRESFWNEHQNTLVQFRQHLLSGKRSRSKLSPSGNAATVSPTLNQKKSKHPPFGKYRHTVSPFLPKLSTPVDSGKKVLLTPRKFDVVPPVKPKLAFTKHVEDYDSWGETSHDDEDDDDDDDEDYADDSSDKSGNQIKSTRSQRKSWHQGKPPRHYKPRLRPQVQPSPAPAVVYGVPFPVYYPPPPQRSISNRLPQMNKSDSGRKVQSHQTAGASKIPVLKNKKKPPQRTRRNTSRGRKPAVTPVLYPPTFDEDEEESEDVDNEFVKPALLYMKQHPVFASDFTDWFIQDCLHTDLLPDFLIETFTEIRHMPYNHPVYVPSVYCCEDLLSDHVSEMVTSIVRDTVAEMADDYMDDKMHRDPLGDFLTTLTEDVIASSLREIVRSAVVELAEEHLSTEYATRIVHGLVDEYLGDISEDLLEEVQFDLAAEEFISSEVIAPEIREETEVVAREVIQNFDNRVMRRQLREVKHLADLKLADVMLMGLVFSVMSQPGQLSTEDDHFHKHLDDLIFNESLQQIYKLNKERNKTLLCKPLHKLHEKAVSDVALDVFLQQLSRFLDEDLADVDEYERCVTDEAVSSVLVLHR